MVMYPVPFTEQPGRPLQGFRRRNRCLIYRLSPERPAYCGDCVLGVAGPPSQAGRR